MILLTSIGPINNDSSDDCKLLGTSNFIPLISEIYLSFIEMSETCKKINVIFLEKRLYYFFKIKRNS